MKQITFLLVFISIFGYSQPQLTDANIQSAVDLWVSDVSTATSTYGNISDWDVSQVTDMSDLFQGKTTFNDDISRWDVSSVTTMNNMFYMTTTFNQDIGDWDVSQVTDVYHMFYRTHSFNQNIGAWDVSNVTTMDFMFHSSSSFNQDITSWCVTNIISEPNSFSTFSPLSEINKPIWGTCPSFGIDDQNQLDISIYPNPVSDIVYIDGSSSQLKIVVFDILGKQVLNKSNTNTINVSLLSKGVYFIKVSDGINSSTKKFIKN